MSIWKTKDGREIEVIEMDINHLKNTIELLKRAAYTKHAKTLSFYLTCPNPNGDIAMLAFEKEQNRVFNSEWQDYLPNIYHEMVEKLRQRSAEKEREVR